MATPAAPSDRLEETVGDLTYIRTDNDLPPVAIIDRSPITTKHKIVFGVIALVGAIAWAIIAFFRGETVNAVWFVIAAICTYVIGFRFYARLIESKIVKPRDDVATPAEVFENATDYMPTDRRVLFGHHFAAIAGAGPLVGPVLAMQMGYLPGTIWIIVGAVVAGCVQDYLVLSISVRRRGRSLGQMAKDELGVVGGAAAIVGVLVIMVILLAVLALVVVNALAESPWGVFSIAMTIPIALFMGVYLRFLRPGRVSEVSLIGVALLLLAVVSGGWVAETDWGTDWFTLSKVTLSWCIVIYGLSASVLPVWLLLAPRDYLSTFMKVGTIVLLAIGILLARPIMEAPAVSSFASSGTGPVFAGSLFPFLFITIACGALSGFHSLISSGTTPKLLEKESQMRLIGYGGMLTESFVAIMALITAAILNQHLYFVMNAPAASTGTTAQTAADYVNGLGLSGPPISGAEIDAAAQSVGEDKIVSRTGGAPTLAFGMSEVLHQVFGGAGLKAFWYHFAIMFEALFILTTVDAGTRVARFMLSDALGNLGGPLKKLQNPSWRVGAWICSLIVVAAWGCILVDGCQCAPGWHQHPVPAVRHRQPVARRHRVDRRHRGGHQAGTAEMGLDSRGSAAVGPDGDHDGVVPEDLLRRPEGRLLDAALPVPRRPGRRQDGVRRRQEPGSARRRHQQHVHSGHAVDCVRVVGLHRVRRRCHHGAQIDPRHGPSAHRGRAGAIPDLRTVGHDSDQGREGGARAVGRATEVGRQIRWYWSSLMGDNHYRRYVEHRSRTHPGEPVLTEREYWRMRHDATERNPQSRCC